MLLQRLGSGHGLQILGDLYEVDKNTLSKIIKEFCRVVKKHLQLVFVQTQIESQFRILVSRFEQLHDIPYIIRAIDGSYVYVLATDTKKHPFIH